MGVKKTEVKLSLQQRRHAEKVRQKYKVEATIGAGAFGAVTRAVHVETHEVVAIKKVQYEPGFHNRELEIMEMLRHPTIIGLKDSFTEECAAVADVSQKRRTKRGEREDAEEQKNNIYLNVVMEYVPVTLHRCIQEDQQIRHAMVIKCFMFQLLRAVAYLQLPSVNVCHRDLKPENVLVDAATGVLKICDFGSAKQLSPDEPSIAYICSRHYRAPELLLGNQRYSPAIDVWSVGCIFYEMLHRRPMFKGKDAADQRSLVPLQPPPQLARSKMSAAVLHPQQGPIGAVQVPYLLVVQVATS